MRIDETINEAFAPIARAMVEFVFFSIPVGESELPLIVVWLIVAGFLGMASKFVECTLGVKYRQMNADGSVSGGPMFYMDKGLAERRLPRLGKAKAWYYAGCIMLASCAEPQEEISPASPPPTIYAAGTLITMDPGLPRAEAVAVADERILAVGTLAELRGRYPGAAVDETFAERVVMAGLIDQHLHPFLAALTMTAEVVSIEEWVLPARMFPAARDRDAYLCLLGAAAANMEDPAEPLISWGYHHYLHGSLTRKDLDAISESRPIMVWHRSAHEFVLNTPALAAAGVTEALVAAEEEVIREQIDLADGHFWERGSFDFLVPRLMPMLAAPDRFRAGLAALTGGCEIRWA